MGERTIRIFWVEDQVSGDRRIRDWIECAATEASMPTRLSFQWVIVQNRQDAFKEMDLSERHASPFDLALVDLQIPPEPGQLEEIQHGLAVLERLQGASYPLQIVVLTRYDKDKTVLEQRALRVVSSRQQLVADLLGKDCFDAPPSKQAPIWPKLIRLFVPLDLVLKKLRQEVGLYVQSTPMKEVIRELYLQAQRAPVDHHLGRILICGGSGSGKSKLAEAYRALLPKVQPARGFEMESCASAVAEGHGGRITLFGTDEFQGISNLPGVFERATVRPDGKGKPDYKRAGVVFLDELAELKPELQAAILTALEEGKIRREGAKRTEFQIACHVVFATNADLLHRDQQSIIRTDLLDRIPCILELPSLHDRVDEIDFLVRSFAQERLNAATTGNVAVDDIVLSPTVSEILRRAVLSGQITSLRQLKAIVSLAPGETLITEGNLQPLLKKLRAFRQGQAVLSGASGLPVSDMATALSLPHRMRQGPWPKSTESAIRHAYSRWCGEASFTDPLPEEEPIRDALVLLSGLVPRQNHQKIYPKPDALRTARSRVLGKIGMTGKIKRGDRVGRVVDYLLGAWNPPIQE